MIETRVSPSSATTANSKKWDSKPLGEVCEIKGGGTPSTQVQSYWQGDLPWVSPKDMKSETIIDSIDHISNEAIVCSATNLVIKESILMVVRSGILARTVPIAIAGRDLAINQDIKAFTPKPYLNSRFLYLFLESQMNRLLALVSKGATVHRLNVDQLKTLRVPLPSLQEQERIVAILDEAFEGIATAEANTRRNLKNSRDIFDSGLELRLAGTHPGWVTKPLSELCEFKHGFAFKSEHFLAEGKYVLLTPGNFYEHGGYRDRGEKQKYYGLEFPNDFLLNSGDLLVAMTEQAAGLLGSPIIVPESGYFLHNQRLGLVKSRPGIPWLNRFFFYVFNTKSFRKAVHDGASGVKVRHTSPTKLGEVSVSFPLSLEAQQTVVSEMEEAYSDTVRLEAVYTKKLVELKRLGESLLHQAFSGNL